MANAQFTPVRTHILRALALGVKYESGKAKYAPNPTAREEHIKRMLDLGRAFERVESHKFTTC